MKLRFYAGPWDGCEFKPADCISSLKDALQDQRAALASAASAAGDLDMVRRRAERAERMLDKLIGED